MTAPIGVDGLKPRNPSEKTSADKTRPARCHTYLSLVLGNQITSISMIPSLIPGMLPAGVNPLMISISFGIVLASMFMTISLVKFNKMQF
nr:hypothetical protein [Candidatus Sigynarchaeum springense]MDO8118622.1 hypothetical protein [Candidatus Sigynarchaeota archaeon]